jgi:hypothetical protein
MVAERIGTDAPVHIPSPGGAGTVADREGPAADEETVAR